MPQGGQSPDKAPDSCQPSPQSLSSCPVLGVVDVEAQGAGEGEGQVGDHGNSLHPGGPGDVLQVKQGKNEPKYQPSGAGGSHSLPATSHHW